MVNSSGFFKIHIDHIPVGNYKLQLNLASPITLDLNFKSNSNKLSPIYTQAERVSPT